MHTTKHTQVSQRVDVLTAETVVHGVVDGLLNTHRFKPAFVVQVYCAQYVHIVRDIWSLEYPWLAIMRHQAERHFPLESLLGLFLGFLSQTHEDAGFLVFTLAERGYLGRRGEGLDGVLE